MENNTEIMVPSEEALVATEQVVEAGCSSSKVCGAVGVGVLLGIGLTAVHRKFIKPWLAKRKAKKQANATAKNGPQDYTGEVEVEDSYEDSKE